MSDTYKTQLSSEVHERGRISAVAVLSSMRIYALLAAMGEQIVKFW